MIDNYLKILEDSLKKKVTVLDEIAEYNSVQEELLKKEELSIVELDKNMAQKDVLIKKLLVLDEGFESLYEKIREQFLQNKSLYREQISSIQNLISVITDKSVSIQAQEARNKQLIETYFMKERGQLKQGRTASKVAYGYYKNMNNTNVVPPQFMDQKK